jgi:hypothetical protein
MTDPVFSTVSIRLVEEVNPSANHMRFGCCDSLSFHILGPS